MVQENPQIKEFIDARAFLTAKALEQPNQCFKIIGAQPAVVAVRHQREMRKHLAEIKYPIARRLFILAEPVHHNHIHIGAYAPGRRSAGSLESAKAAKLAFAGHTRLLARRMIAAKVLEREVAEGAAA